MSVLIVTSLGDIVVDLNTDKCPLTSKNFLKLCKIKYYNGCLFHNVQKDFTAQTGDPTGTGAGGDSIYKYLYGDQARFFSDEIHLDLKHSKTGTVAMASAGENLNASQFYFTLRDDLDYLDGKHTVFGEVAEGLDTLARINEAYIDEKGRPYKNIRIKHTYVLDDPFDDPSQLADLIPGASPEGKPKDEVDDDVRLEDDWVPMDEQLGTSELEEVLRSKEAHSSAVVLESIGDIPDAEIRPPENVLFVCKLNPVTEDEDLHTIFSRFGTVVSADIIRDFKTGDSLCYAFIEFETNEACQEAYFKMDNALIDDRRIHVDFSQSVSKLWSQYRRKSNQMSKGNGCFKCGALDHIAKDCSGDPAIMQPPKYILKDDNTQRGGGNNSRYEMVFEGDTPKSPTREKRHWEYSPDGQIDKQSKTRRSSGEEKHLAEAKKDSRDRHRQDDRSRGYRVDDMAREGKVNRSHGIRRDRDYSEERREIEKHRERRRDSDDYKREEWDSRKKNTNTDDHKDRRDGEDYRKRNADSMKRVERRDDGGHRKNNSDYDRKLNSRDDDRDSRKRSADYSSRGNGRDDKEYRNRNADNERRDRQDTKDGSNHGKVYKDNDGHKSRREDQRRGEY